MSSYWLLGPGESGLFYKEQMKQLKGKDTIAFNSVYPNCVEHFGITPKYWTWLDPTAAIPGLKYLLTAKERPEKIFLLSPALHSKKSTGCVQYIGSSKTCRRPGKWEEYIGLLKKAEKKGVVLEKIPMTSIKYMMTKEEEHKDIIANIDDPKCRFGQGKLILGSQILRLEGKNPLTRLPYDGWQAAESKFSLYMLPLLAYLKAKNAYVIGFDSQGGRFYSPESNLGYFPDLLSLLGKWQSWCKYLDMNVFSVVDSKHSKLNDYFDYIPFEKALERNL